MPALRSLRIARLVAFAHIAAPLAAQQTAHYAVQRDTLRYELDNPFRMYWVRGSDTIGDRAHGRTVETHA